jgi:hypothetical protein
MFIDYSVGTLRVKYVYIKERKKEKKERKKEIYKDR